jgi:hypothetical protein
MPGVATASTNWDVLRTVVAPYALIGRKLPDIRPT